LFEHRTIGYSYGTSGGINDTLKHLDTIADTTGGSTKLARYTYMDSGNVIRTTYPQPSVWLDLWGGTTGTFIGLDQFNRVIDQRWQNETTNTPADIDRYQYGYDPNSNRLYKANVVGTPKSDLFEHPLQTRHVRECVREFMEVARNSDRIWKSWNGPEGPIPGVKT
jgi:hypothetical protein